MADLRFGILPGRTDKAKVSMAKVNLLYVITKLELGGAQKHLLNLIKGLDNTAHRVTTE